MTSRETRPLHPLNPLRTGADGEESPTCPEALLISALLESGQFTPEKHHVVDDDVEAWKKLWGFCCEYQAKAGCAPPEILVKDRFSEFEPTPGVSPVWAASKVLEASASRSLRIHSKAMLAALGEGDLSGAFDALDGVQRPRSSRKQANSIFEPQLLADIEESKKIPVPYRPLMIATKGGIGPGQLVYLAARLGQGKSWELMGYAACAATAGFNVCIVSIEMPAAEVAKRALLRLVRKGESYLTAMIESSDEVTRAEGAKIIKARTPGKIEVVDPSHGRVSSTSAVAELCREYDLVIVDHVGLMTTSDGRRAIDDWRVMAVISNTLREITLATGTPILAAAQVNREGEGGNRKAPPKASQLAQSDALGQDCDVLVMMKRLSDRVMIHEAAKVRNGPTVRWHTRFDPAQNRFEEIDAAAAEDLEMMDEDRRATA